MSFQLIFTAQYEKRAARFLKRHPELEKQYLKTPHQAKAGKAIGVPLSDEAIVILTRIIH